MMNHIALPGMKLPIGMAMVLVCGVAMADGAKAAADTRTAQKRTIRIEQNHALYLPIGNSARKVKLQRSSSGADLPPLDVQLVPAAKADWWAPMEVASLRGRELTFSIADVPAGEPDLLAGISTSAPALRSRADEPRRPQFHYSQRFGWNNDPNGMVYRDGEWHFFHQHNPYGIGWGNMHWYHAVTRDFVHWTECGDALAPDALGTMFSGCGVVDRDNVAGFGANALVFFYTAAGNPFTQCLASSVDGRTLVKYPGNPIVGNRSNGNRDPKVFWHAPSKAWVMVLYGDNGKNHVFWIYRSNDLKHWTPASTLVGDPLGKGNWRFECPGLEELRIEGESGTAWVLWGAGPYYDVGTFDGFTFKPIEEKLYWVQDRDTTYYAAQTFSNAPEGRSVWVAWLRLPEEKTNTFSQSYSLPMDLSLRRTKNGLRLVRRVAKELTALRKGPAVPLAQFNGELVEAHLACRLPATGTVRFDLRGIPLAYDAQTAKLTVDGRTVDWPVEHGRLALQVYLDRTSIEILSEDGLLLVPKAIAPDPSRRTLSASVPDGTTECDFRAYELSAIDVSAGGYQGQFVLHNGTQNHMPTQLAGAMTAGVRFKSLGTFSGVQACCPSYGNNVGTLTLSIYPWAGDVAASRARGALASKRFVDFRDNAWLKLDFAPLPTGEYYAELSEGAEMVGVWKSRQSVDYATSYLNGKPVEGSYEFGLTLVNGDSAVPFVGDAELYALQTAPSLAPAPAPAFAGRDLFADTWDAMDGLGRVLGNAETLPAPRSRQAGIFYWTWHQGDDVAQNGPLNNAEILAPDPTRADRPDDPAWGPAFRRHHWDKPLFGYYRTTDEWVSRRHAQLLAAAGIDNVVFDATNGKQTWMDSLWTLAKTWSEMRKDGMKTPQFTYMLPFNENPNQMLSILQLYRDLYRPGKYHELWYYWQGRPLIHANPRLIQQAARNPKASAEDRRDWLEILQFFTFRPLQPSYVYGPDTLDEWCWLEVYPQHACVRKSDGRYEFCAAGVAQNHSWLKGDGTQGLAAMNDRNVFGRAYMGPSEAELKPGEKLRFAPDRNPRRNEPNRFLWGDNFAQQLDHALAIDPDYLFVTGWNEWIAGLFPNWMGRKMALPDEYSPPFSRDLEPSEGVLKDHCYHQLVQGIRRFKGVRPQRTAGENPIYRDFVKDTTPRDAAGYGPMRYRDTSGRNDIVECFVEHDAATLVFRVRCAASITPHTDARWMRLFISCGLVADDPRANWEHFHFVLNRVTPPDAHTAILEACTGGWNWKEVARVPMNVVGDTLTLRISRAVIGQDRKLDVRFKWADNTPGDSGDVLDFYRLGDAAPDARFLYRYFER